MINKNIKWFSILELIIYFSIFIIIISLLINIVLKTNLFNSNLENKYYILYELNNIEYNIINTFDGCINLNINNDWTIKDTFINNDWIYYDQLSFYCDGKNITLAIIDKKEYNIIDNFYKNNLWWFFTIFIDNEIYYVNKNINILNFSFNILDWFDNKLFKLSFFYDNNILNILEKKSDNYISDYKYFLYFNKSKP